jgi:hypothetical protein
MKHQQSDEISLFDTLALIKEQRDREQRKLMPDIDDLQGWFCEGWHGERGIMASAIP